jgi:hypothetical protein
MKRVHTRVLEYILEYLSKKGGEYEYFSEYLWKKGGEYEYFSEYLWKKGGEYEYFSEYKVLECTRNFRVPTHKTGP